MPGAVINAVALLPGSIFIIYESVNRILNPQMPDVYWMMGIAVLGIAFNGVAVWKLNSNNSMNKKVTDHSFGGRRIGVGCGFHRQYHIWSLTGEKMVITVNATATDLSTVDHVRALKDEIRHVFKPLNTEYINIDLSV